MTPEEYEFILFDRLNKIIETNKLYDLEHRAYISLSGKDSLITSSVRVVKVAPLI